MNEMSAGH